ncbi:MAG: RnfABCDGE type electron transport complex subunit B, partial [Oscillospiraceae bacterium]|nr:RnfABCDGE type electron transport complex subunit B [Oscillospiraceae bacterium]
CGACGFAGCDGYAAALIEGEGVKTNLCVPGGDAVAQGISEILGVAFEDVVEQIAVVHCGGSKSVAARKAAYQGVQSCAAAKLVYGGENACPFGCIGLGDCAAICPNGAIRIEDGIARIDTRRCTGCGMCAKVCPNRIIYTEADTITTVVTCCSTEKGAVTRKKCTHGCIGCKKCERECPAQAITVTNNLAKIDYEKCTGCGHCAEVCTTKCIEQASFAGIFRK